MTSETTPCLTVTSSSPFPEGSEQAGGAIRPRKRCTRGPKQKKPRFTAVISLTSDHVADAQELVERVLDRLASDGGWMKW